MTHRDGFEEITFSTCPECSSEAHYDSVYDFYSCQNCGETWSYGANDPDYDDEGVCSECQIGRLHDHPDGWECSQCGVTIYDPPYSVTQGKRTWEVELN